MAGPGVPGPPRVEDQIDDLLIDADIVKLTRQGYTQSEIAAATGLSQPSVSRRLNRVRRTILIDDAGALALRCQQIVALRHVRRKLVAAMRLDDPDSPLDLRMVHAFIALTRREAQVVGSDAAGPWSTGAHPDDLLDPDEEDEEDGVDVEMEAALELQDLIELTDRLVTAGIEPVPGREPVSAPSGESEPAVTLTDLVRDRDAPPSAAVDRDKLP